MFLRFLLVGGSGYLIDAGITHLLISLGIAPWIARIPAIALAILFTWISNRYFTFEVKTDHKASEALRYVTIAMAMALINYLIYFVLVTYYVWPVTAVTLATACQTICSFYLYRQFVFKRSQ